MEQHTRHRRRKPRTNPVLVLMVAMLAVVAVVLACVLLFGNRAAELKSELTVEAGAALPDASAFLADGAQAQISYADTSAVQVNKIGVYKVTLLCDGKKRDASIRVVDTVAPVATAQTVQIFGVAQPEAKEFVTNIQDGTTVTVTYLAAPSAAPGEQTVTVVLTDEAGNSTQLQAKLVRTVDTTAPVITGAKDITVYQGDSVQYMSGIIVTDDLDTDPQIVVDRSTVDLSTPGEYTVTYTVTDKGGNTVSASVKLTVLPKKDNYVSYDVIYAEVDEILAEIITDGMDTKQKAYAVYYWIRTNCGYADGSDKDDWMQAAYSMMQTHLGDCFNYFSLCKLMLERLEIPNIDVHKVKNYDTDSNHYWSLVSVDGGKTYYHLDTTPRKEFVNLFMRTDKFMDEYSAAHNNCFNRDKSLYPATPEEDFE